MLDSIDFLSIQQRMLHRVVSEWKIKDKKIIYYSPYEHSQSSIWNQHSM